MWWRRGSEEGSYVRLIDCCISQLYANEEEEEEEGSEGRAIFWEYEKISEEEGKGHTNVIDLHRKHLYLAMLTLLPTAID